MLEFLCVLDSIPVEGFCVISFNSGNVNFPVAKNKKIPFRKRISSVVKSSFSISKHKILRILKFVQQVPKNGSFQQGLATAACLSQAYFLILSPVSALENPASLKDEFTKPARTRTWNDYLLTIKQTGSSYFSYQLWKKYVKEHKLESPLYFSTGLALGIGSTVAVHYLFPKIINPGVSLGDSKLLADSLTKLEYMRGNVKYILEKFQESKVRHYQLYKLSKKLWKNLGGCKIYLELKEPGSFNQFPNLPEPVFDASLYKLNLPHQ